MSESVLEKNDETIKVEANSKEYLETIISETNCKKKFNGA